MGFRNGIFRYLIATAYLKNGLAHLEDGKNPVSAGNLPTRSAAVAAGSAGIPARQSVREHAKEEAAAFNVEGRRFFLFALRAHGGQGCPRSQQRRARCPLTVF
jgi:hypothetical protein